MRDIGLPTIISMVISAVISSVWGLLVFYLQNRVQNRAKKKLEAFKKKLDILASDHSMSFDHFHPKRAEVLEITYSALYDSFVALRRLASGVDLSDIQKIRQKIDFVDKNIRSFLEAFAQKKIYLSFDLTEKLEEIYNLMRDEAQHCRAIIAHASAKISDQKIGVAEAEREAFLEISKIYKHVKGPMKKRFIEIETECRGILQPLHDRNETIGYSVRVNKEL